MSGFPYAILGDDNTPEHAAASVNKEDARSNLYEVRRLTGFTWEVIADLAMVTRRTLYNWAQGGAVAEDSKRHIAAVLAVLRYSDRGTAEKNAVALYEPHREGDPFWLLKCQRYEEAKRFLGKGCGRVALPAVNDPRIAPLGIGYFDNDDFQKEGGK